MDGFGVHFNNGLGMCYHLTETRVALGEWSVVGQSSVVNQGSGCVMYNWSCSIFNGVRGSGKVWSSVIGTNVGMVDGSSRRNGNE